MNFHYTLDYDNTDDEYPYKAMCGECSAFNVEYKLLNAYTIDDS